MFKKIVLCSILSLSLLANAQDEVSGSEIQGLVLGAQLRNELFGNNIGGSARYWDKYFGADIGLSFYNTDLESSTGASTNASSLGANLMLLAGRQFKSFKPHVFAGITYDAFDQFGADISKMAVRGGLGVDVFVTNHLVMGLDVIDFSYIFDADVAGSTLDFDGSSFGFFNMFRIGYLF